MSKNERSRRAFLTSLAVTGVAAAGASIVSDSEASAQTLLADQVAEDLTKVAEMIASMRRTQFQQSRRRSVNLVPNAAQMKDAFAALSPSRQAVVAQSAAELSRPGERRLSLLDPDEIRNRMASRRSGQRGSAADSTPAGGVTDAVAFVLSVQRPAPLIDYVTTSGLLLDAFGNFPTFLAKIEQEARK